MPKQNPIDVAIRSYKGFGLDWKCRDFQYEVGKTYEHEGAVKACDAGFHACENPLDVFKYYPPGTSVFAVVEQNGTVSRDSEDSKLASRSITIKAHISLSDLVNAGFEYTWSKCVAPDPTSPASATGYSGAASATGVRGAASATGYSGAASATGDSGAASATGVSGVAMATGRNGKAMAIDGGAIFLVYRDLDWNIVHARASKVGDNDIKANTWYSLDEHGAFIEVRP